MSAGIDEREQAKASCAVEELELERHAIVCLTKSVERTKGCEGVVAQIDKMVKTTD